MKTLEEEWVDYRDACFPQGGCPLAQQREMKQAWFASALTVLTGSLELADLPDMEAARRLEALMNEAREFGNQTISTNNKSGPGRIDGGFCPAVEGQGR